MCSSSGHGHFSRAVITRWVELPVVAGIRFAMVAASIAVCGFEHGVRQISALGLTRSPATRACRHDAEPTFMLAGRDRRVVADGVHSRYSAGWPPRGPLCARQRPQSFWARLPFDIRTSGVDPRRNRCGSPTGLPDWPHRPRSPRCGSRSHSRSPRNTAPASTRMRPARGSGMHLHKVVLARALRLAADAPLDARASCIGSSPTTPAANVLSGRPTAAGGRYSGTALVGASPELLVARDGDQVTCRPFAGSAPRSADPDADAATGAALAASAKNRHEHQLVVDADARGTATRCA